MQNAGYNANEPFDSNNVRLSNEPAGLNAALQLPSPVKFENTMKPKNIRIKIAESMGYKWFLFSRGNKRRRLALPMQVSHWDEQWRIEANGNEPLVNEVVLFELVPNYPDDLNACAQFRKGLTEFEKREFISILEHVVNRRLTISTGDSDGWHFALVDSFPIEQCEARLRQLGQWEEGE